MVKDKDIESFLSRNKKLLGQPNADFIQLHDEYEEEIDKYFLLRRSANAELVGVIPKPVNKINEVATSSYIYPFFVESKKVYNVRLQNSIDVPIVDKFLNSLTGAVSKAGYTIDVDFNVVSGYDYHDKFFRNIDNQDTSFSVFLSEILYEIFLMGKAFVVTDIVNGIPFSKIVKREQVLNWHYNDVGEIDYFAYYDRRFVFERGKRTYYDAVIVHEPFLTTIYSAPAKNGRFGFSVESDWSVARVENDLERVAVRDAWFGDDARSVLYPVALMQVDFVNLLSEMRQQIRNQGVAILTGPRGFADQLKSMSVNSAVELDNDDRAISWVSYPSYTLDSHFRYAEMLKNLMYDIAQSVTVDPSASGISKQWDFLNTESILNTAVTSVEELVKQVISDWFYVLGVQVVPDYDFRFSRDFNSVAVRQTIDNLISALTVGLGSVSEVKIKKEIRDKLVRLTPDELRESDAEIENLIYGEKELTKTIMSNKESDNGDKKSGD